MTKRVVGKVVVMSARAGVAGEAAREGTTGRVVPSIWAVAEAMPQALKPLPPEDVDGRAEARPIQSEDVAATEAPVAELAFYRKYTEAMVRRFGRLSLDAARVPSLVGRELFRGKASSYRVEGLDDAVIFCHDIERCLLKLNKAEQRLVKRITLQQYSFGEAAGVLGMSLGNCIRQYGRAIDRLTGILLEVGLLRPLEQVRRS